MKVKYRITRRLLYHNDGYTQYNIFKTKQAIAVMVQPI